jgi:hypothetical protein
VPLGPAAWRFRSVAAGRDAPADERPFGYSWRPRRPKPPHWTQTKEERGNVAFSSAQPAAAEGRVGPSSWWLDELDQHGLVRPPRRQRPPPVRCMERSAVPSMVGTRFVCHEDKFGMPSDGVQVPQTPTGVSPALLIKGVAYDDHGR